MASVAEYYEGTITAQFAQAIADAPAEVLSQPALTATYTISGDEGGTYGVRIADGQLEIVPGGIPESDMRVVAEVGEWRQGADVGMANPFDYYRRRKVNLIKSLKGAVNLDLSNEDGNNLQGAIIFGNIAEPAVTVQMKASDYLAMMTGKLNGQMAFMTGKLKFDGSLPLLMQVAALNS